MSEPTPADVEAARYVAEIDFGLEASGNRYTFYRCEDGRFIEVYEQMNDWDFDISVSREWLDEAEARRRIDDLRTRQTREAELQQQADEQAEKEAFAQAWDLFLYRADVALPILGLGLIGVWYAATQRVELAVCLVGLAAVGGMRRAGARRLAPRDHRGNLEIAGLTTAVLVLLMWQLPGTTGPGLATAPWWVLHALAFPALGLWCLMRLLRGAQADRQPADGSDGNSFLQGS